MLWSMDGYSLAVSMWRGETNGDSLGWGQKTFRFLCGGQMLHGVRYRKGVVWSLVRTTKGIWLQQFFCLGRFMLV